MEIQLVQLLTSVISAVISVIAILGIISKFSNKLLNSLLKKWIESIKFKDLDPRSDIYDFMKDVVELKIQFNAFKDEDNIQREVLTNIQNSLKEITNELGDLKRERFRSDLRSRLEYTITKKGKVDRSYWDHIVQDYTYYSNELKMNSYMGSLYKSAEKLYIKSNVTKESVN